MDRSTTLDAVDLESSRFLVAVSSGTASLDAPVPSCPGWDVAHLLDHLGSIYGARALIVSARRSAPPSPPKCRAAPEGEARVGWFAEQRAAMLAALESANEETVVWNWTDTSPGPIGFWGRRMTHKTLIHRVDAELAQGSQPARSVPEVAADAVAEFFELFLPRFEAKLLESWANDSIHLHATDVPGAEWTLRRRRGRLRADEPARESRRRHCGEPPSSSPAGPGGAFLPSGSKYSVIWTSQPDSLELLASERRSGAGCRKRAALRPLQLGGEDSNPQLQGQNLPCCRLHHPRMGGVIVTGAAPWLARL